MDDWLGAISAAAFEENGILEHLWLDLVWQRT